jgi:elongation factor Ts
MAEITATMVKELREKTGAGMMDCKTALIESQGNMETAVDWLRAKGLSKAARKATRVAAEGLVGVAVEGTSGALVEINSETDFVARNEKFQAMVSGIARLALTAEGSIDKLRGTGFPGSGRTVAEHVAEMVATIGENMIVRRTAIFTVKNGSIGSYVHNQVAAGLGRIGVVVGIESSGRGDELKDLARRMAMHVAAANPIAMDLASVAPETLARERAILIEKNAGKPSQVLERIIASGLRSFAKEACLLDQIYVHDGTRTVQQVLKEAAARLGGPVKVAGFIRFQLGEGVERSAGDFAAEVAKAAEVR